MRPRIAVSLLLALAVAPAARAADRPRFDVRVLASVPDPGFVALTTLGPDRTIYGGTFYPASGNGGDGVPSHVFAWSPEGKLLHDYTIQGQDLSADHGIQATTVDAQGRVMLLNTSPASVLRLDPATGQQVTYATIPDLPSCPAPVPCSDTSVDLGPDPDYAAWGPDGTLYVTDTQQATIFSIPPGGGPAHVWLTDPRFDSVMFGLTGIALKPDHRTIAVTAAASSPLTGGTAGQLFQIPIGLDGKAGTATPIWTSGPVEAPDGFAYAASGDAYVALLGPNVNQVAVLNPQGTQIDRFPAAGASTTPPFDSPSSVTYDGSRLIVTNDAYFSADRTHQVLFDVESGEAGSPILIPGRGPTAPGTAPPAVSARVRVRATPRHLRVHRRTRITITATVLRGTAAAPIAAGTPVQLLGKAGVFDSRGRAHVIVRAPRRGKLVLRVSVPGATAGRTSLYVRRARR